MFEICLLQTEWKFPTEPNWTSKKIYRYEGSIINNNNEISDSETKDLFPFSLFEKFKQAFDDRYGGMTWPLFLEILNKSSNQPSSSSDTMDITLRSIIFKAVHEILHFGDQSVPLKIVFLAKRVQIDTYGLDPDVVLSPIIADQFVPHVGEDMTTYEASSVQIPAVYNSNSTYRSYSFKWKICLKIMGDGFINLTDILPRFSDNSRTRKILSDKKFCDFEIVSENGTCIPCHKNFLYGRSAVLDNMLQDDFQEKQLNKMTMSDMSTDGINALLDFIYCNDIREAALSCDVALELLKAADKYDIQVLWRAMNAILMGRSHGWYDVDTTLQLYDFVNKCEREESVALKKKSIKVLAMKPVQLSKSSLYKELFSNPVSRDLFNSALVANRP